MPVSKAEDCAFHRTSQILLSTTLQLGEGKENYAP